VIYLYAIAEELAELPPGHGIAGAPLRRRSLEGLDLVVSDLDGEPPEATEEGVLAHARAIESLLPRSGALLPARFGRAFADEAALEEAVRARLPALREALGRVRGCVELGVSVVAEERPAAAPAASGRAYMEARLAESESAERLARELHEPLAGLSRASTHAVGKTPRLLLSGAYLVEPDAVEAFRSCVAELERAHPELGFACTGPWPAYSFAPGA
jgi:Gas vesicle synthesis protein GvpL/GvpF